MRCDSFLLYSYELLASILTRNRLYPSVLLLLAGINWFTGPVLVKAQEESAFRPLIDVSDLKKLDKADEYRLKAEQMTDEASQLNMEMLSVQQDPNIPIREAEKKSKKLEDNAVSRQIEAGELYEKANEIRFTVYRKYIDRFWEANTGRESEFLNAKLVEEQASDNYFQAINYRVEANRMGNGISRVEKITEANNLEEEAIRKQLSALGAYYGIAAEEKEPGGPAGAEVAADQSDENQMLNGTPAGSQETYPDLPRSPLEEPDLSPRDGVTVNQEMIDRYNRYIASGKLGDTTLSTGKIAASTEFEADRLLSLWYEYVYGRDAYSEQDMATASPDKPDSVSKVPVTARPLASNETEIGIVTDENRGTLVPADEEVIYRVQIAAHRTELSQRALSRIYYGNKNVEMINENGWYKYSVGDFASYEEANAFRKRSGISNAFVVAFRKGMHVYPEPGEAGQAELAIPPPAQGGPQNIPPGLVFRIQVAASRVPVSREQLKRIYPGDQAVEMIEEDGWYKYQLMGTRLYSDAVQIIRGITTRGAFIVAYEDGVKSNLADAVRKNQSLEQLVRSRGRKGQIEEIEFHIQIAASRVRLKTDELSAIYTGSEPVALIHEDGWYKYRLKAGNSPVRALQLKASCNVSGAFIIPYRRAYKISMAEAIKEIN